MGRGFHGIHHSRRTENKPDRKLFYRLFILLSFVITLFSIRIFTSLYASSNLTIPTAQVSSKIITSPQRDPIPKETNDDLFVVKSIIVSTRASPPPNTIERKPKCQEECYEFGTCNEELGKCHCPADRSGPTCAEFAMPSCHLAPDYYTPCTFVSSCACMLECEKYRFVHPNICFDERRSGRDDELTATNLLVGPQAIIHTDGSGFEISPRKIINKNLTVKILAPPNKCPRSCSGIGVCLGATKTCLCPWTLSGDGCEIPKGQEPFRCLNACNNRGTCINGVCKCRKSHFGIDCSLSYSSEDVVKIVKQVPYFWTKAIPAPVGKAKLRIYVYDLPGYFNTWQYIHSSSLPSHEPLYFLERLLTSPYRTTDPYDADLYFVPIIVRQRNLEKLHFIDWVVTYLKKTWHFWNIMNGRDHVFILSTDWGSCQLSKPKQRDPIIARSIHLTLWGLTKNMDLGKDAPCFLKGQDIAIPPSVNRIFYESSPYITGKHLYRGTLLSFRPNLPKSAKDVVDGEFKWSFGVQQRVMELYGTRVNKTTINVLTGTLNSTLVREMARSTFCLAPCSKGWSTLLAEAVLMGCIPVIVQPDVVLPFEGELINWSSISVVLNIHDLSKIELILQGIPKEEVAKKRAMLAKVWTRFVWSSPQFNPIPGLSPSNHSNLANTIYKKDVFYSIMQSLNTRLNKM